LDYLHALYLALLQGFTEFLPISSSAHLILLPKLLGWEDQGLVFDIAVHFGSLLAVVTYFRHDIILITRDWSQSVVQRKSVGQSRLGWAVLWGTVPVGIAGLVLHDWVESSLRSNMVIASTTIGFGLLLWYADKRGRHKRTEDSLNWKDVLIIGVAQAIALIPGTSRSGITITAALMLGLTRKAAARFSFLLSIPTIILAAGYQTLKISQAHLPVDLLFVSIGIVASAITAYVCIHLFLAVIERIGMFPFVLYRMLLGATLIFATVSGVA